MLDAVQIYRQLQDKLHELDEIREEYYKKVEPFKYTFWTLFVLVGSFLLIRLNVSDFGFIPDGQLAKLTIGYFISVFVTLVAFLAANNYFSSKFKEMFTSQIAPHIIRGLDPTFKYEYEGEIPRMEVVSSLLFSPFNTYKCQDLVMGVINDLSIKFAEIKLEKVVVSKDSKRFENIFSGIFYRADLQVQFPTDIWLVPRKMEKSLRDEKKKRVDQDTKQLGGYRVYTDDVESARIVLQPFILEKIEILNAKLKKNRISKGPLSFHFGSQWVQISIPTRNKFMEPKLSRTIDHISFVEEQTILLNAIASLMDDLTLK